MALNKESFFFGKWGKLNVKNIINVPSATSIEFYDMTPGTILTINGNNKFVIGVTGTLILNNLDEPITKIKLNANSFFVNSYPTENYKSYTEEALNELELAQAQELKRDVIDYTYWTGEEGVAQSDDPILADVLQKMWQPYGYVIVGYTAEGNAAFDKIKKITIKSYPCRQFFGDKMPLKLATGDYDLTKQYYSYNRLTHHSSAIGFVSEYEYYRDEYYERDDIFRNLDLINNVIESPIFKFIN